MFFKMWMLPILFLWNIPFWGLFNWLFNIDYQPFFNWLEKMEKDYYKNGI